MNRLRSFGWVFTALALLFAPPLAAFEFGEPRFETIGDAQSIPDGNVTALTEDSRGFIWIGSTGGLVRFDGYRFRRFVHDPANPKSLNGNLVRALLPARDGRLWIATESDGVAVFDPTRETFQRIVHGDSADGSRGLSDNRLRALADDGHGGVWIGGLGGLDHWREQQPIQALRHRRDAGDTSDWEGIRAMATDADGNLWIGSNAGLSRLAVGADAPEPVRSTDPRLRQRVLSLAALPDGRLAVSTVAGEQYLWLPDRGEIQLQNKGVDHATVRVQSLLPVARRELWLGSSEGVDVIDPDDGRVLKRWRAALTAGSSFQLLDVRAMLRDRTGMVWLGGYGSGLQRFDPNSAALKVLRHRAGPDPGLSHPSIGSVLVAADGRLWLGTRGNGVDVLDRQRGVIGGVRAERGRPGALVNGVVISLADDRNGGVWLGTDIGLFRVDPATYHAEPVPLSGEFADIPIRRLLTSSSGDLWIGCAIGVMLRSHRTGESVALTGADGAPLRLQVNTFVETRDGRLWLGSQTGLYTVAPGTRVLQPVRAAGQTEATWARPVQGMLLDRRGQLWIAGERDLRRLIDWDGRTARFEAAPEHLAMAEKPFGVNLMEDPAGRLWTPGYVYDPTSGAAYHLGRADGVDFGTPWFRSYAKTSDGLLLFGGSEGLLVIDPAKFRPWHYLPPVVATEVKVDGRVLPTAGSLRVPAEAKSFSVEFAALDFSAPRQNRYRYRLTGFDRGWTDADADHRVASYSNLWPGDYVLEVHGSNRNGDWSPHRLTVPITVLPAFWQTAWFVLLLALAFGGGSFAAYRWRTRRMRQHAAFLETAVAERSQALTASIRREREHEKLLVQEKLATASQLTAGLAHEINNPIHFASLAAQNLAEQLQDFADFLRRLAGEDAEPEVLAGFDGYFAGFQQELGSILDGTRRVGGIVQDLRAFSRLDPPEPRAQPIGELLQATVRLVGSRYRQSIDFIVEIDDDPPIVCLPARLNQAFMNLIVNACHAMESKAAHAATTLTGTRYRGRLDVRAKRVGGVLQLSFEDNGGGIPKALQERIFEAFFTTKPAEHGTGLGLAVSLGIVREHQGRLDLASSDADGSCFTILLPVAPDGAAG